MPDRRHVEFFGPDLGRGPFAASSPPVAAVQLAMMLAQLRAPLSRADADIEAHADFVRDLADRLFPDFAEQVHLDVGDESGDAIDTVIRQDTGTYAVLRCWLADDQGGGVTATAPDDVSFKTGEVLETITADKQFLVLTPLNGVVTATVSYSGDHTWRWAVARNGRVFYSNALNFD